MKQNEKCGGLGAGSGRAGEAATSVKVLLVAWANKDSSTELECVGYLEKAYQKAAHVD